MSYHKTMPSCIFLILTSFQTQEQAPQTLDEQMSTLELGPNEEIEQKREDEPMHLEDNRISMNLSSPTSMKDELAQRSSSKPVDVHPSEPKKPKPSFLKMLKKAPVKMWNRLSSLTGKKSKRPKLVILNDPENTCMLPSSPLTSIS
jgi:hypothetical protein